MPTYGNNDNAVSPHLKVWIQQGDIDVCGLIGQGTSRQLQSNWNSPFEQSSVGSMMEKTGGIVQATTGATSQTTLNSTQIWEGNRPITFTINLLLYAISDPQKEVMQALSALELMASPEVNSAMPVSLVSDQTVGRIPGTVTLNIGRKTIISDVVIESISSPLDKERDSSGNLIRAEVQLQLATKTMLNKSDINKTWQQ